MRIKSVTLKNKKTGKIITVIRRPKPKINGRSKLA